MVIKPRQRPGNAGQQFESRVVLDGNQTTAIYYNEVTGFESRVVLDGNQTTLKHGTVWPQFESRVVLDGNQLPASDTPHYMRLRVVLF